MDNIYNIQVTEARKMQEIKYHDMINYFCNKFNYNDSKHLQPIAYNPYNSL